MRVAVVHDTVSDTDAPDAQDVWAQAEAVCQALIHLGHDPVKLSCDLDLNGIRRRLDEAGSEVVFNLVESLEGHGRLIHLFPALLETMRLPYTGARAEAMLLTSHKVLAKEKMAAAALPVPEWIGPWPSTGGTGPTARGQAGTWIIKSVWEHASIGLDADCLVSDAAPEVVLPLLVSRAPKLGGACFAERFIEGREFNLALLGGAAGVEVLPPAEITFEGYTAEMARIVDYRAKWDEASYAYHHTPRRFEFAAEDRPLLAHLQTLALRCWEVFGLHGYARVDFRVDVAGAPWILEVNANPCLSPDAGYAAGLAQAGVSMAEAVRRILTDIPAVAGQFGS